MTGEHLWKNHRNTPQYVDHRRQNSAPNRVTLGVVAVAAVLAAGYAHKVWDAVYGKSNESLNGPIADFLKEDPGKVESFDSGVLIPEDERPGENILISIPKLGQLHHLTVSGIYRSYLEETMKPFLDSLPAGTNVHIAISDADKDECMEVAKELFPNLNFSIYELPYGGGGIEFIQDNVFATGSTDEKGRFEIAKSGKDREAFEKDTTPARFEPWWATMSTNERAEYATRMFADDFLAKSYPDKFTATNLDLRFEGGDLHITRLPSGKTALVIGRKTIADNVTINKKTGHPYQESAVISSNEAVSQLSDIKEDFKQRFGVDEVIVLAEDSILRFNRTEDGRPAPLMNALFFHTDMALKTATNPDGEHIAFCTDYDPAKLPALTESICDATGCYDDDGQKMPIEKLVPKLQPTIDYLKDIQDQFQALGYKVVKLPCGTNAVLNYTNSVMFTGKSGEKFVIVPQYGIPEDKEAVMAYMNAGFKVLTANYSEVIAGIKSAAEYNNVIAGIVDGKEADAGVNDTGSWHCRTVVLGGTLPTPKKVEPPIIQKEKKQPIKQPKSWKQQHVAPNQHPSHRQQAQKNPQLGKKKRHIPPYQKHVYPRD